MDVTFANGRLVTPGGIVEASVGVRNGRIAAIAESPPSASETIDLGGTYVLPGLIDAHVHFRDPAYPEWEDFDTGTAAAAAGGVTTVFEMPNAQVGIATADLLVERAETVQPRARVDFGLFGGASHHNLDEIPAMASAGAIGFKTYLIRPYPGRDENFSRCWVENDAQLFQAFEAVAATGRVAAAHCENQSLIDHATARLRAAGRQDLLALFDSRLPVTEVEAVSRAVLIARETGARLHIVHLTTGEALSVVARARAAGQVLTAEATPPHLYFTREVVQTQGPYGLHIPPLRQQADVDALWEGLRRGSVDYIATDHAAFSDPADKEVGWQDPWQVKCGDALIESMLPLLLTDVNAGRFGLGEVARWCSEAPAHIFGLYPRKGALQLGSDADLTVVDLEAEYRIDKSRYYSRGGPLAHPFDGWKCKGKPVMTVVRGRVVMRDGVVVGDPGWGTWVKPESGGA
jgi:allantoinase